MFSFVDLCEWHTIFLLTVVTASSRLHANDCERERGPSSTATEVSWDSRNNARCSITQELSGRSWLPLLLLQELILELPFQVMVTFSPCDVTVEAVD